MAEPTLGYLADFVAENLPEDYVLVLTMRYREFDLSLYGPDEGYFDVCQISASELAEMVLRCVNVARTRDGLSPLNIKGESVPPGFNPDEC